MLAFLLENADESWLNMTNAMLGGVTLICLLVVAFGVFQVVTAKIRERAHSRSHFVFDDHAFQTPEMGLTMADGGERADENHNHKQ